MIIGTCNVVRARVRLKETGQPRDYDWSEPIEYVEIDGKYYEKKWIESVVPVKREQLIFMDEVCEDIGF